MRPQHNAAENAFFVGHDLLPQGASMRPQHNAAENRRHTYRLPFRLFASMRPQHNAAENVPDGGRTGGIRGELQ